MTAEAEPDFEAALRRGRELAAGAAEGVAARRRLALRRSRPHARRDSRLRLCEDSRRWIDPSAGSELLSMMALVAAVVAIVILVFFGVGYLFGRLFL